MKKNVLRKASFILAMIMAMVLAGCGSSPSGSEDGIASGGNSGEKNYAGREMSVLIGSVTLGDAYKTLFEDFEKETGIKVDMQVVPGDSAQYAQIVQSKIATKEYTDIMIYTSGPSYLNSLNPEENVLEITNPEWLGKMKEGITDLGGTKDGKVYGIPFGGVDFTGLLCNMNVFDELSLTPPSTYEELVDVCQKIKYSGKDITPIYEMGKQGGPLSAFIYVDVAAEYAKDLSIIDKINTGEVRFEDTFVLDSLERKMALQDKGFFNDDLMSGTWDTLSTELNNNTVAMSFVYSNVLPTIYNNCPDANVTMVPLNDVVASTFTQAIYRMNTENADLTEEFVNYFLKNSTLEKLYTSLGVVSPYVGIENDLDPTLAPMCERLDAGKRAPVMFDQLIVNPGQVPILQEMHMKTKTPKEACIALSDKMAELGKDMGLPGFSD